MRMTELLKIFLGINLIFISVTFATDNNKSNESLNHQFKSVIPIAYNVTLLIFRNERDYKNEHIYETVFHKKNIYEMFNKFIYKRREEGNFIFYGESILHFEDIGEKRILRLHTSNLVINIRATIIRYFANGTYHEIAPKEHKVHKKEQTIDIVFDYPFLRGINTYRVIMKFLGSITDNTGGIIKTSYINDKGNKTWLFIANFQGAGARQIFPCWDEPDTRTNFTFFVKHDENYRALSNAEINKMFRVKHAKNWTLFKPTVKISPNQVMIVLHNLKRVNDSDMWCRQHVQQQVQFVQSIAKIATLYLKFKYDDIIHPLTVNHVVIPGFQDTAIPSWGIVLHRESDVIYDEKIDFIAWKFEMAFMIARKIAHQYIGNLIAQSSWSYLWLNEGIATFLAMKIVDQQVYPQLMDLLLVKFQHECLRLNDYYNMSLIHEVNTSDINSLFSITHYVKAPIFIYSLDKALPEEILDISINDYISEYKFKSVNTSTTTLENFFSVIRYNLITEEPKEYVDVMKIFTQWTKQERYHVLKTQRVSLLNEVRVYVAERAEPCPEKLSLHLTYITQKNPNTTQKIWLIEPYTDLYLHVDSSDWIIINIQQAGYYRVNYDYDIWQKLGNYLNMEHFNIHVLNRAQIIDDAYYFLSTNNLNFNLFKALTHYLSNETDYIAWYPVFKILEEISSFFPFPQSSEVKEHFRKILDNVLEKIGYLDDLEEDEFTKCLRLEAAKWACTLNSRDCTTVAVYHLIWFYEKPDPNIWPGWKEWTYRKGMMLAPNFTWNKVLTADALDDKRFEYLACSENDTIIIDYINRLMSGYFTTFQHHITVYHSIIARHAKNDLILDYILNNFKNVVPSEIEPIVALTGIINYMYSTEQIYKVKDTLLKKVNPVLNVHSYIGKKIELRLLQIEKHIGYFERFLKTKSINI